MRVLLLYPWHHHLGMMKTFAHYLERYEVYVDILCMEKYQFEGISRIDTLTRFILWAGRIAKKIHPYIIQEMIINYLESNTFHYIFKNYDCIDLHSFMDFYRCIVINCIKNGHPYDITVWGSDVLRASAEDFDRRELGYEYSRHIKGFDKLLNVLSSVYDHKYDDKMIPAYLGNNTLPIIDDISENERIQLSIKLGIYYPDRILVTCGYNASPSQQHSIIIDAVSKLDSIDKGRIHIILPMTYDRSEPYINETVTLLKKTGVNYTVLNEFLTERELAVLRIQSQVFIDTQTTDSFNGALRETLYSENIALIADWLEYPPYDRENVYYIGINESNLTSTLHLIIYNFGEYKQKCIGNKVKLKRLVSWEYCVKPWVDSYKSMEK